jgi:hypothetical protein
MSQTKARLKIHNQINAPIKYSKGVKQGDGLSPTLFILALHNAVWDIEERGTIYTKSRHICVYADDIAVITRSETRLRQVYREIEEKTQQMGLMVNKKKTKYKIMSVTQKG